jgi:hypothetical protein
MRSNIFGMLALFFWEMIQNIVAIFVYTFFKITGRIAVIYTFKDVNIIYVRGNKFSGIALGRLIFANERFIEMGLNKERVFPMYGYTKMSLFLGPLYLIVVGLPVLFWTIVGQVYKLFTKKIWQGYDKVWPKTWADKLAE